MSESSTPTPRDDGKSEEVARILSSLPEESRDMLISFLTGGRPHSSSTSDNANAPSKEVVTVLNASNLKALCPLSPLTWDDLEEEKFRVSTSSYLRSAIRLPAGGVIEGSLGLKKRVAMEFIIGVRTATESWRLKLSESYRSYELKKDISEPATLMRDLIAALASVGNACSELIEQGPAAICAIIDVGKPDVCINYAVDTIFTAYNTVLSPTKALRIPRILWRWLEWGPPPSTPYEEVCQSYLSIVNNSVYLNNLPSTLLFSVFIFRCSILPWQDLDIDWQSIMECGDTGVGKVKHWLSTLRDKAAIKQFFDCSGDKGAMTQPWVTVARAGARSARRQHGHDGVRDSSANSAAGSRRPSASNNSHSSFKRSRSEGPYRSNSPGAKKVAWTDMSSVRCYRCGRSGHVPSGCPNIPASAVGGGPKKNRFCYRCWHPCGEDKASHKCPPSQVIQQKVVVAFASSRISVGVISISSFPVVLFDSGAEVSVICSKDVAAIRSLGLSVRSIAVPSLTLMDFSTSRSIDSTVGVVINTVLGNIEFRVIDFPMEIVIVGQPFLRSYSLCHNAVYNQKRWCYPCITTKQALYGSLTQANYQ